MGVAKPEGFPVQPRQDLLPDIDGKPFRVHGLVDGAGRVTAQEDRPGRSARWWVWVKPHIGTERTAVLEALAPSPVLPRDIARLAGLQGYPLAAAENPECRLDQAVNAIYLAGICLACSRPRLFLVPFHSPPTGLCAGPAMPQ
jgi:hypothetical protein